MKYIAGSGELELFLPYLPFHSGSLPPAVDGDPVRDELAAIRQYDQDNLAFLVSHPSSDAMALVGEAFAYRVLRRFLFAADVLARRARSAQYHFLIDGERSEAYRTVPTPSSHRPAPLEVMVFDDLDLNDLDLIESCGEKIPPNGVQYPVALHVLSPGRVDSFRSLLGHLRSSLSSEENRQLLQRGAHQPEHAITMQIYHANIPPLAVEGPLVILGHASTPSQVTLAYQRSDL